MLRVGTLELEIQSSLWTSGVRAGLVALACAGKFAPIM